MGFCLFVFFVLFFSALAVGNPHSKVPYSKLKSTNIIGLPASIHLRHPSTMPQDQLELIHRSLATIKFVGK